MADEPLEALSDPEEEEGGPVKSFLEHLEDLRWVLIKVIAAVLIGMTICMVASPYVVEFLEWPMKQAGIPINLEIISPIGGFMMSMKMAFWGGLVFALPFVLFFIAQFVMPALKKNEKPYFRKAFVIGGGLFMMGVILCYGVIMPIALKGMIAFNEWLGFKSTMWRAEEYMQFVVMFMVGMGLSFEIPVVVLTLVKLGIISHELMAKSRMYFFIANMVICAFITPDAISTVFMVLPVQILMEICIQISAHWERQKRKAEALQPR